MNTRERPYMNRRARRTASGNRHRRVIVICAVGALLFGGVWLFTLKTPGAVSLSEAHEAETLEPEPTLTPELTHTPELVLKSTPEPAAVVITVTAAGDCTLGGDTRNGTLAAFDRVWKSKGSEYFLKNLEPVFSADDITVVNLEGPLTTADKHVQKKYAFKGRPEYAKILSAGGVDVCNLANNHSEDYKAQGTADTKAALEAEGIGYFGFSDTYLTTIKGVTVGFCGFFAREADVNRVRETIRSLREECDVVIVSFHWGTEYKYTPDKACVELGRLAIDEGADLVLGHHTHVVGAVEQYKGKYIVYSLGNACFGGNYGPDDSDTFLFQQSFILEDGAVRDNGINIIPCRISSSSYRNNYQPTLLNTKDGERVLKKITDAGKNLEGGVDFFLHREK